MLKSGEDKRSEASGIANRDSEESVPNYSAIDESPDLKILIYRELEHDRSITYLQALKMIARNAYGPFGVQFIKGAARFANSVILANLSFNPDVRAATTLINTFDDFAFSTLNAPLMYVSTAVGNLNNANDKNRIGQMTHAGWLLALCCAIPQMTLLFFSKKILDGCGQQPDLTNLVQSFLRISLISAPLLNIQLVSDQMALTTGHKCSPIVARIMSVGGGFLLLYPLAYGRWGAPDLNIEGVAWSLVARGLIYNFIFFSYLAISNRIGISNAYWGSFKSYNLFKFKKEGFSTAFNLLFQKGLPITAIYASEMGVMYLLNILTGRMGKDELAAQLVISQYSSILLVPVSACGTAVQITISNTLKTSRSNIALFGNITLLVSLIVPAIYILLTLLIPRIIISLFINLEDDNYKYAVTLLTQDKLLLIGGINLAFNSLRVVSAQSLIGAGISNLPLVVGMGAAWVGVGLGSILAFVEDLGMLGLNLGVGVGLFISAIAQIIYWKHKSQFIRQEPQKDNVTAESTTNLNAGLVNTSTNGANLYTQKPLPPLASTLSHGNSDIGFFAVAAAPTHYKPRVTAALA